VSLRRGVDVVLNALAGEAIPMGMACLAEFGRFIESETVKRARVVKQAGIKAQ